MDSVVQVLDDVDETVSSTGMKCISYGCAGTYYQ